MQPTAEAVSALCPTCHQHTAAQQGQPSHCTPPAWPPGTQLSCPALPLAAPDLPALDFSSQPDPLLDLLDEWGFDMQPLGGSDWPAEPQSLLHARAQETACALPLEPMLSPRQSPAECHDDANSSPAASPAQSSCPSPSPSCSQVARSSCPQPHNMTSYGISCLLVHRWILMAALLTCLALAVRLHAVTIRPSHTLLRSMELQEAHEQSQTSSLSPSPHSPALHGPRAGSCSSAPVQKGSTRRAQRGRPRRFQLPDELEAPASGKQESLLLRSGMQPLCVRLILLLTATHATPPHPDRLQKVCKRTGHAKSASCYHLCRLQDLPGLLGRARSEVPSPSTSSALLRRQWLTGDEPCDVTAACLD